MKQELTPSLFEQCLLILSTIALPFVGHAIFGWGGFALAVLCWLIGARFGLVAPLVQGKDRAK